MRAFTRPRSRLLTTIAGMTGLWIAVLADTGATILVAANALRLLRWKA
jgi:Cd2+/Zn2+-exporting ATPase